MFHKIQSGQTIIELLVVIGVMAVILPALLTGLVTSRQGKAQEQARLQAVSLLQQTQEAVRNVREAGWSTFSIDGTFHPVISGSTWSLVSGSSTANGYTTAVVISDVYRNNGAIVTSGGTLDPSTKKVDTTISWGLPYASSLTATTYLTRWLDNASYTDTTQAQFNAGNLSGVVVQATTGSSLPNDGEVVLGAGGYGNWCSPSLDAHTLDMPGNNSESVITAIAGNAYTAMGGNASGDSLDHITIPAVTPPTAPSPSLAGSYNNQKSYGVFGDTNYGYITSDHPGLTLDIVQITSTPYTEVGTANAGGAGNAVYVQNNLAYVTGLNSKVLWIFDLTTKTGSHTPVATVTLAGFGQQVYVSGTNAYVVENSTSPQLQIIPLGSNGKTPGTPVNITVNGLAGVDMAMSSDGKRAYLATAYSSTKPEFFIIDTDPTSATYKQTKGNYSTTATGGMNPTSVAIVPGNRAILAGSGGENYAVLDISNETAPTRCGGLTTAYGIRGLAPVIDANGNAYTYVLANTNPEFRIVDGGPGGSYATSGIFESAVFNPGYSTANNRFSADFSTPSGTTLQFQVSMASPVGGVCPTSGYTYVDFSGNYNSWSTLVSGQSYTYPFATVTGGTYSYTNPGQCLRYRAQFTTSNSSSTPVLNDVTINYSP